MAVLILVEHNNQMMHPSTRHVLHAALQLDPAPILCVIGHQCEAVVDAVSRLDGAAAVWVADDPMYASPIAESVSGLLVTLSPSFRYIMAASTTYGKDILPRVAGVIDVAQVSDVTAIVDQNTFERPIYAGNLIQTVRVLDDHNILTIRHTAFDAVVDATSPCAIKVIPPNMTPAQAVFVERVSNQSVRLSLSHADIVVSGGRGLKSQENFALIEQLADVLGGAVGASRAAVDAGFVSNDCQIGQTGKIVAPRIYIAIGISGATQHIAGMKESRLIIAINQDPDAPILQIAHYALVGDLFVLVPELIQQS